MTGASYAEAGQGSGTKCTCTVAAADSGGAVGTRSTAVSATTTGDQTQCFTDDNDDQVAAGRAHRSLGCVYADGSNQYMGLYNVAATAPLRRPRPATT